MICPRCNTRNGLGTDRCQACGYPFTRRAARYTPRGAGFTPQRQGTHPPPQAPLTPPQAAPQPSPGHYAPESAPPRQPRRRRTYRRKQGPGSRAIGGLIAFLIITILIVAAAAVLGSGNRSTNIGGVAERAGQLVGFSGEDDSPPLDIPEVSDEPAGDTTWILTQDELNQRIADRSGSFGPARDVRIELNEGMVTLRFRAHGFNGTYHGTLEARDGVPVVADSKIDAPLGWVVSSSRIDDILNDEIARAVAEQQVSVESVHIHPGQVVFGVQGG